MTHALHLQDQKPDFEEKDVWVVSVLTARFMQLKPESQRIIL